MIISTPRGNDLIIFPVSPFSVCNTFLEKEKVLHTGKGKSITQRKRR